MKSVNITLLHTWSMPEIINPISLFNKNYYDCFFLYENDTDFSYYIKASFWSCWSAYVSRTYCIIPRIEQELELPAYDSRTYCIIPRIEQELKLPAYVSRACCIIPRIEQELNRTTCVCF